MGKSLMAGPERAPLVRQAFEEYATGRLTKEQLLRQARAWNLTNSIESLHLPTDGAWPLTDMLV